MDTVTPVSLEQMLAAREQRVTRQTTALVRFDKPLLSMTVVIPGPVKDGALPRRVLAAALQQVEIVCSAGASRILSRDVVWPETGPEALYVIDIDAMTLKSAAVRLEECHPLGRLWDLNVLGPRLGPLTRETLGLPPRPCLICDRPAHACSRSRQHSLAELWTAIWRMVHAYDHRSVA